MSDNRLDRFVGTTPCNFTMREIRAAENAVLRCVEAMMGGRKYDTEVKVLHESKSHLHYPYQTRPQLIIEVNPAKSIKGVDNNGFITFIPKIVFVIRKERGYFQGKEIRDEKHQFKGYEQIETNVISWDCEIRLPLSRQRKPHSRRPFMASVSGSYEYALAPCDWDFSRAVAYMREIIEHPTNKPLKL